MQTMFFGAAPFAGASPPDAVPADMVQRLCEPWLAFARSGALAPFDACRTMHAAAVHAGLAQRSLLASADFEQRLGRLERLALGLWARGR